MIRLPRATLFVQTLGLVFATLIVAQATAVIVLLNLPPPPPEVFTVGDVVRAIGSPVGTDVETHGGRTLITHRAAKPPFDQTVGRRRLNFRFDLARALNIDVAHIVIGQRGSNFAALAVPQRLLHPLLGDRPGPGQEPPLLFNRFQLAVVQSDGSWLIIQPKTTFGLDPWRQRLLLVLVLAALAVSPLAWAFARRLAAPIIALAAGAERLGRDPGARPLDISGSAEVRAAVTAFNEMQARLQRHVGFRTTMIAAIAHDLRTPLTRLRFRIEATPPTLRDKLAADIDQMESMVTATLDFVRVVAEPRDRRKLELSSLLDTVMEEARLTGGLATMAAGEKLIVDGDSLALKRMIVNLVDNALKFGGAARGRLYTKAGMAIVEIEDDGPGMPDADMERAFEPFFRLETSRNRETGGIGLGLAVVRAVARGHGGDVALGNRQVGGLRATVSIPLFEANRSDI